MNALTLIPSKPLDPNSVLMAAAMFDQNYGTVTAKEKWQMLSSMIYEESWTDERFQRTLKHLLKSNKWATWTIADWFSYSLDLHPETWYQQQVTEHGASVNAQIEEYDLGGGLRGYRYADGQTLPFSRRMVKDIPKPRLASWDTCPTCYRDVAPGGECSECKREAVK